jgi:hypothetical protein
MTTERKLPFDCQVGTHKEIVANRFSGETIELQPDAVAVYDTIIGAEHLGYYKTVQQGLSWFRQHYPSEYMVLLD